MMIIRHRAPYRSALASRLRRFKRNVLRETASGFPGWVPLALRWKAPRRMPQVAVRSEARSQFNSLTTHVHATVNNFGSTLLRQTVATGGTLVERVSRSIEKWMSPPLLRVAPVDRWIRVPVLPTARALVAASSEIRELPARVQHPDIYGRRRPIQLDAPEWRRVVGERGARSPISRQPVSTGAPAATYSAVPRIRRDFSPLELAERKRHKVAPSGGPEGWTSTSAVEFFGKTPELIWRQTQPPKPAESHHAASPDARTAGGEPTPTSSRTTGVGDFVPDVPTARKPMGLSDLEPSFVDRLADDVIRRVERRTRIERERRGL
jgi:hypothetical protein